MGGEVSTGSTSKTWSIVEYEKHTSDHVEIRKRVKKAREDSENKGGNLEDYLVVIIALGDYFHDALVGYDYDEPSVAGWNRDVIVENRKRFLKNHFSRYYTVKEDEDFEKIYECYLGREERFGCIVYSADNHLLVVKPKGSGKYTFPKGCRKDFKIGEEREGETAAAVRETSEETSIAEELLTPLVNEDQFVKVRRHLSYIKMFMCYSDLKSNDVGFKIVTEELPSDEVDGAAWKSQEDLLHENICGRKKLVRTRERLLDKYKHLTKLCLDEMIEKKYYRGLGEPEHRPIWQRGIEPLSIVIGIAFGALLHIILTRF